MIVLITGASGTGKTTLAKALEQHLSSQNASVYYFDDIGVPDTKTMIKDHGSAEKWQEWALGLWIKRINDITDKELIFLEGSFYPKYAVDKLQELGIKIYQIICLSTDRATREKRLIHERNSPELVTQDMENYAKVLEAKTIEYGGIVIDSSNKEMSELIWEVVDSIQVSRKTFEK